MLAVQATRSNKYPSAPKTFGSDV